MSVIATQDVPREMRASIVDALLSGEWFVHVASRHGVSTSTVARIGATVGMMKIPAKAGRPAKRKLIKAAGC